MKGPMRMLLAPAVIMGLNALGLDYADPKVLLGARVGFVAVQLLCLGVYLFMMQKARANADATEVVVKKRPSPFAVAKATAAGADTSAATAETAQTTTVCSYDQETVKSLLKNLLVGSLITGFIHYKWGYVPPLVIQAIMNPITLASHPLFNIYVLGKPAVGDLKRPFAEENPASMFGMGAPAAPEADAAAAETEQEQPPTEEEDKKPRLEAAGDATVAPATTAESKKDQ